MLNYIRLNKTYLAEIHNLEEDLIKANGVIEELRLLVNKQTEAIVDLSVANSSAELVGTSLESREFEVTKWQNKYVDLVNRSLDKVPVFKEVIDDRIEAGEVEKESINTRIPWHTRRRQLENADRIEAGKLREAANQAMANNKTALDTQGLTQAVKDLEEDFAAGEKS